MLFSRQPRMRSSIRAIPKSILLRMQSNLRLLKIIGWQALDLMPPSRVGDGPAVIDQIVEQEGMAVWTTLFDHAPCAIAIADRAGHLIRVNHKFCMLAGFSTTEVINRRLNELTSCFGPFESAESKVTASAEQFSCSESERICAISRQDGSKVWCRQTTIPCGDQSKQPDWVICYFNELRDSAEAIQLLVESHQRFVRYQTEQMEQSDEQLQLQPAGRLAPKLVRQSASVQQQVELLIQWLTPLRAQSSKQGKSARMIESAY
jgi:PAS domain S-box-containing protein